MSVILTGTVDLTLWTIRLSTLFYVLALLQWLRGRDQAARVLWTIGCGLFLMHAAAAFHFHHHWSHDAAYRETARQTKELFGFDSGSGIYWNYVFTLLWTGDVLWRWFGSGRRAAWINWCVHGFLAFLFFNGAVVFAKNPMRGASLAAMVLILVAASISRRKKAAEA